MIVDDIMRCPKVGRVEAGDWLGWWLGGGVQRCGVEAGGKARVLPRGCRGVRGGLEPSGYENFLGFLMSFPFSVGYFWE